VTSYNLAKYEQLVLHRMLAAIPPTLLPMLSSNRLNTKEGDHISIFDNMNEVYENFQVQLSYAMVEIDLY
jgi:hypothetical protein